MDDLLPKGIHESVISNKVSLALKDAEDNSIPYKINSTDYLYESIVTSL